VRLASSVLQANRAAKIEVDYLRAKFRVQGPDVHRYGLPPENRIDGQPARGAPD